MSNQVVDYKLRIQSRDFPWEITIGCTDDNLINQLKKVFSHFICQITDQSARANLFCEQTNNSQYCLYNENRVLEESIKKEQLLGTIIEWIMSSYYLDVHGYSCFHGGVIQDPIGRRWGIIGISHTGKTSLELLLLKNGWLVGNDEILIIENNEGNYIPFPLPFFYRDNTYLPREELEYVKMIAETVTYNYREEVIEKRLLLDTQEKKMVDKGNLCGFLVLDRCTSKEHRKPVITLKEKADASYYLSIHGRNPLNPIQTVYNAISLGNRIPLYIVCYSDTKELAAYLIKSYCNL